MDATDARARVKCTYALRLRGIRFNAHVGVSNAERAIEQELVVDVDLELPERSFPKVDRRSAVVDYDAVATAVVEVGRSARHRLLETFAAKVIDRLFALTPAHEVRVAVTKRNVPTKHHVDVAIIERTASRKPE